jgi:rhodanese-related sulfurtransferase
MFGISKRSFLAYDMLGSALWAGAYIGCGFLFAEKMAQVTQHLSAVADAIILIFGVPLLLLFVWKLIILVRMFRVLRFYRVTAQQLKSELDAGRKIGVIDLLRFEEDPEDEPGIPGAVRLDPREIRRKKHIHLPDDVSVVIYCRTKNSFASARVAAAMRKHGIQRVQVLAGGLEAWKTLGFPLSAEFADPLTELNRLGVEVDPPWQPLPAKKR